MAHTPGPWKVRDRTQLHGFSYPFHIGNPYLRNTVCDCLRHADARLIAAAPEMLEALEGALERLESYEIMGPERAAVERAIKKAKGE